MISKLNPAISRRIWGGKKLNDLKGIPVDTSLDPIGETWEVSTHPEGISTLSNNQKLSELVELNFLVKFLDTSDVLSVQVHPNNEYSLKNENQKGKCECWLILETEKEAGIYLGFKKGVTQATLKEALIKNKNINDLLNYYPVNVGDFFLVPPGTIHSIGRGVTLVEVQQSSGVTYRVWDWNRLDQNGNPRKLHVKEAFDVLEFDETKNDLKYFQFKKDLLLNELEGHSLIVEEYFKVKLYVQNKNKKLKINLDQNKSYALIILAGQLNWGPAYQSFFINKETEIKIETLENSSFILVE